jgi:DNA modification methylase
MTTNRNKIVPTKKRKPTSDTFQFEPIKGYPMLHWKGKRPFSSTQFYPAQLKETYGSQQDNWINKIFWGDNLQVMSHLLKEYRGKVDLIYIDPPFDSKADYKKKIKLKGRKVMNDQNSFEEKQYTDIWTNDEYLQFMYERLIMLRELLSEKGSIYLHCDWHKNHYLRCILDEVFGNENFRNEIIWGYPGREMHIEKKFNAKHDTILLFAKTDSVKINMKDVAIPYDKANRIKTLRRKVYEDENGREWVWETRGQASGQEPYKRYIDEILEGGKALNDLWTDVQFLRGNDPQRENYPTQKPEELLERIIKASSNTGDLIFDCFMGSGTTQAVAMKLGRRFIGADINLGAVETTTKRLLKIKQELEASEDKNTTYYTGFSVYNVNNYDVFRNPIQAKEILKKALDIQPLPQNVLYDGEKDGRMVKIMPVNRIATRSDLNQLIMNFNYKSFEKKSEQHPGRAVEHLLLICMGHEPDLAAALQKEVPYKLDIEVVDILRDKSNLEFKRDSEAEVVIDEGQLVVKEFFPMNLLQKLSLQKENVDNWKELTESIKIDWNYDGSIFEPREVDIPGKNQLVCGVYSIPKEAGTIKVKITDLLSESFETAIAYV